MTPLTCADLTTLIYDYVEDLLEDERVDHVRVHLKACPHCTVYIEAYRFSARVGKKLARETEMSPAFAAKLQALMEAECGSGKTG